MVKKSRGGQTVNSSQQRRQSYLRRKKIGAVLIEFAFSIPVFLVLIYYIHDLPKMKLMQRKNQFVANFIAASIQNISKQRQNANQKLTVNDIINTIRLAVLCVFPGMTQYSQGGTWGYKYMPLGHMPMVNFLVFSGTGENTAKIKYHHRLYPCSDSVNGVYTDGGTGGTIINFNATQASSIYRDFTISSGETKCIIDFRFHNDSNIDLGTSGISTRTITKSKLFGFLFYNPVTPDGNGYFHAVTIFTPKWNFSSDLPWW